MSSTKPKPIPDNYRRVTPTLVVDGGVKALEFYTEVFDAKERIRFPGPGDTIAHAELDIGDSVVMVEDASPFLRTQAPPPGGVDGSPISLFIYVEDADDVIERAVNLGATLKRPPEQQFYGDRVYECVDPEGHRWKFAQHIRDVDSHTLKRPS